MGFEVISAFSKAIHKITLVLERRRPAWTDRILYCAAKGKERAVRMVEGSYTSHPYISLSDHKPVSADFIVQVRA